MPRASAATAGPVRATSRHAVDKRVMLPRLLLVASTVMLVLFGLVMIYSASSVTALNDYGDSAYYLKSQLKFMAVGIVVLVAVAKIPYTFWTGRAGWALWALAVLALLATAVFGYSGTSGATRWISLGPLGSFQPSEFAKVIVLVTAGSIIVRYKSEEIGFKDAMTAGAIAIVIPCALILAQPDLGTTSILVFGILAEMWLADVDLRPLLYLLPIIIILGVIAIVVAPYRLKRVETMFDPFSDPLGDGYQLVNSLYAFGSGGVGGVGLGLSHQKYLYLPEASTDFIFAVIGEELGLVGTISVVALFLVYIYAGIQIARNATTRYGMVLAGGCTATVGVQAFLNMACTVGLMPVTGKPLPFISAGGSSLISSLMLTGLILSVSLHSESDIYEERRMGFQVIDGKGGERA